MVTSLRLKRLLANLATEPLVQISTLKDTYLITPIRPYCLSYNAFLK